MTTTVQFDEYGSPEVLKVADEALPEPGEGEVRIANRAVGVNPVDWKILAGYLSKHAPLSFPAVVGNESAGVVKAVGHGVDAFAAGDEVIWYGFAGGYRQEANVPAAQLVRKPAGIDFEQAASLPVAAGTAYSALKQVDVGDGDTVLVHAAAGGVGSAAVQIAAAWGARVIGTASEGNHEYLRSIGAEPVTYGDGLVARVEALGQVTASFDAVGGAGSVAATVALLPDLARAVTAVADEHASDAGIPAVKALDDKVTATARLADEGKLVFAIAERLPLAEAARALELSYGGHVRGKLVLIP